MTSRWPLALVLLLSLALNAVPLWWGLPSWGSWAFDEMEPEHVTENHRWPVKYPPVHRDVLRPLYVAAGWLAEARGVEGVYQASLLHATGRLFSVLLATATVYLVYRCGREVYGRSRQGSRGDAVLAAWVVATLPPFVYYAKTVNLEAPYLFWFTASLLFYLRLLRRHRWRDYLAFAVAAVLAIGSKDQAYGLYVLTPLAIVASLARHHRSTGDPKPWRRAVFDPRIWATGAVTVGGLALVLRWLTDPEWFRRHVETITGPASQSYRLYATDLAGHGAMALQSARHLVFCLGVPLLACAAWGLWRLSRGGALALVGVSYYLTFITPIGYNYVRFFLPVCILLALPAGRALGTLWRLTTWRPDLPRAVAVASRVLVVVLLAHAGVRAVAVDILMLRDVRYDTERRLAEAGGRAVGLGPATLLPRMQTVEWRMLERGACRALEQLDARFLVVHPVGLVDERSLDRLHDGSLGYRVAERFTQRPLLGVLDFGGLWTNLDKIAAEMVVFERAGPCTDAETLMASLPGLQDGPDAEAERAAFARRLLTDPPDGAIVLGEGVTALGISSDRWNRAGQLAALAVAGGAAGGTPVLAVSCGMPESELPFPFHVDDGAAAQEHRCLRQEVLEIELAPVAAGDVRLYLLWTERAWQAEGDRRWLGLRLQPVSWRPGR